MTMLWELSGGALSRQRLDGVVVDGDRLVLAPGRDAGTFEASLPAGEPFDRLVPSLNAEALAPGLVVRVRVRIRDEAGWSPWAPFGVYGGGPDLPRSEVGPDPSRVEVQTDTLVLPRPAAAAEVRLELAREAARSANVTPRVRRLAAALWQSATAGGRAPAPTGPSQAPAGAPPGAAAGVAGRRSAAWGRVLDVPERSQAVEDREIAGKICSPTSLSMVLAFWGHALPTATVAAGVYDHAAKIYGNWSFNVAFAASLGLVATVARCEDFGPVEAEVAAGRPVVISHRYAKGEVTGAAVSATDGHLIVVRGFTDDGDVVVNDPAADPRDGEATRRIYRRADIARSWLRNASGICYLVRT
jgi:hypothetical protein